jgi:hypothetical protein
MACGPVQVVWHNSGENTIMVVPTPVAAGRITAGPGL